MLSSHNFVVLSDDTENGDERQFLPASKGRRGKERLRRAGGRELVLSARETGPVVIYARSGFPQRHHWSAWQKISKPSAYGAGRASCISGDISAGFGCECRRYPTALFSALQEIPMKKTALIARLDARTRGLRARGAAWLTASLMIIAASFGTASAEPRTLTAVMHSGLRVLDPVITTAHITRNHSYMIYDTLLSIDENFKPQPQMASWKVSEDGLTYTFTLRDGLKWHDGAGVTAADCVASLQRWAKRDGGGQMLMDYTASVTATDDKTFTLTLKEPFSYVIELIAKPSAVPLFVMPKRVAETPADKAITDTIGSGPFKFVTAEYQPGVKVVYEKSADYKPRSESASGTAGGKVVKIDRVEWVTMPDATTAVNALNAGEIDYIEQVQFDLVPLLKANSELIVDVHNKLGYQTMGRMNWLHAPFDNPKVRRAALLAIGQTDILNAMVGTAEYARPCNSYYGCGTLLASETGTKELKPDGNIEAAKALLKEAGYDGKPIVLMHPTDVVTLVTQPVVATAALRKAGFNVDLQPMDWQTLVSRRASQKPPAEGGWNIFFTNWVIQEVWNPISNPMLNGRGTKGAWFGWPDDPAIEAMRVEFVKAKTDDERKAIAAKIQEHALAVGNYIPLGQYLVPSAWSKKLSGWMYGPVPVFWNVEKKG
jgi:peptide/nickel transport system substrate-binding protein